MALDRFPGPWYTRVSRWPIRYYEVRSKREDFIIRLHKRYGPVVRVAPRTLSVNDASALHQVFAPVRYLSRPEPLPFFHSYGSENLVSTVDGDLHRDRRKVLRGLYSAGVVDSPYFQAIIQGSVNRFLHFVSNNPDPVEIRPVLRRLAYDIMSHVVYGSSSVLDKDYLHGLESDINWSREESNLRGILFMVYFPNLTLWLRRMRLAPTSIDGSTPSGLAMGAVGREALEALKTPAGAAKRKTPGPETLIHRLYHHYKDSGPSPVIPSEGYILSECFDHFWAGVDTTVAALEPLIEQISAPNNRHYQVALQQEVRNLVPKNSGRLHSCADLKRLPFLNAVIRETLRCNAPIGFSMDRQTSSSGAPVSLCGRHVPHGWTVGASPFVVGRNDTAFHEPERWAPERWMKNDKDEPTSDAQSSDLGVMKRHFFAFGAGPRMCIGINVAWAMMRATIAGIYEGYGTEVAKASESEGIKGTPVAPSGGGLKIIFRKQPMA